VKETPINEDKFQEAINKVKLQDMKAASLDDPINIVFYMQDIIFLCLIFRNYKFDF
jgi:hypothetical protein